MSKIKVIQGTNNRWTVLFGNTPVGWVNEEKEYRHIDIETIFNEHIEDERIISDIIALVKVTEIFKSDWNIISRIAKTENVDLFQRRSVSDLYRIVSDIVIRDTNYPDGLTEFETELLNYQDIILEFFSENN